MKDITINRNKFTFKESIIVKVSENKRLIELLEDLTEINDELTNEFNFFVNGKAINDINFELKKNDEVCICKKNSLPTKEIISKMMSSRLTKEVYEKIINGKVMVLGLGGLGFNIALSLARTSVGKLILIDFDTVDFTNLNRQNYFLKHVGKLKTESLKEQINEINPHVDVETINLKIDSKNIDDLLERCEDEQIILCEAFDKPELKEMIFNKVAFTYENIKLVMGSGMAGYLSSNSIKTKRVLNRIYICGDETSDSSTLNGLISPRVTLCAMHEANMILRLILGETEI